MNNKILKVIQNFQIKGDLIDIEENVQGNINSTYLLTFKNENDISKYLLQKINSSVFKEPYLVMRNIGLVTKHIKSKLSKLNDTSHKTLNFIKTKGNELMCTYINSDC